MNSNYYSYPKGHRIYMSNDKKYEKKLVRLVDMLNDRHCSIIIPPFQRNLNENIISGLQKKLNEDFNYIICISNPIQLAFTSINKSKLIVIDGQHRIEVFKYLIGVNEEYKNREIFINLICCASVHEMEKIYYDINIDKPTNIISKFNNLEIIELILNNCYNILQKKLKDKYSRCFDQRNSYVYSFEDFFNILQHRKFIEKIYNNYSQLTIEELIDKCLEIINELNINIFIKNSNNIHLPGIIIKYCLDNRKIISIKQLNFIDILIEHITF